MAASTDGRLTETVNGVEYWFDEAAADAAVAFFVTYLVLTEGEWAGRPFELQVWQATIVRDVFGWKRPDGTRRYRVLYIEVPRKNGKTELAAGIALLLLVADGELGAQIYTMGVNEDQAKIAFSKATEMVKRSEPLGGHVEAFKTSLFCPELNAALKPITSKVVGKQGFNPSGSVSDELHEWKDGDLYRAVREGEGARRQPLDVMITTAGEFGVGFGWEMHDYAAKVIEGEIVDPSFYAVIYAANDNDDWTDPQVWAKANPNYPMSPKHDFLAEECERAKANPRLENRFKRYFLDLWTEQTTRWLPMDGWDAGVGDRGWRQFEAALAGKVCWGGLDLSSTTDFTALVWVFGADGDLEDKDGDPVLLLPRLWIPEDRVAEKVSKMRRPIDRWVREGAVIATPGNV
ncbi:MAG: terminase large subunit, partial [Pseudomonadota bacterium]